MNNNCPDCGQQFEHPRDLTQWWLQLLKCPAGCGYFLEIIDMRWIYPLVRLDVGVGEKLCEVQEQIIETAIQRIKRIDYKTISTVFFEQMILGIYDQGGEYDVVYKK